MYIVTGGAGFIGSAFIGKLNAEGVRDILVVDNLGHGEKWKNLLGKRFIEIIPPEELIARLPRITTGVRGIVHLGAISSTTETDVDLLLRNNVDYSKALARFAAERSVRFIYASSGSTYGDGSRGFDDDPEKIDSLRPMNPYGFSKHLFDLWVRDEGLLDSVVGLKFFNVFGPNEYAKGSQANWLLRAHAVVRAGGAARLFRSHHPDYADGEQKRDFIYVKDCLGVMWNLLHTSSTNGIFNLGTGRARSWNDLASALFRALRLPPKIEYVEMPPEVREHYQYFTEARMGRLEAAGCPVPITPLEEAVADYVTQYLEKGQATL